MAIEWRADTQNLNSRGRGGASGGVAKVFDGSIAFVGSEASSSI